MKKRLLVTASTFPRWKGDTEPRFVLDLCKYMMDKYLVTVLVPAYPGAADEEFQEGVHIIRYHYFPIHKWEILCYPGAIIPRIKEKKIRIFLVPCLIGALWTKIALINKDYDLIHSHWIIPQGAVQSFFKKPYVVTGHGGDVTSLNKGIMRYFKRRCLKNASVVTAVSDYLKEVEKEISEGIDPKVISMGVDTSKFGAQFRKDNYFNQGDKKVVLFVGRLAEKKGVRYLIDAMDNVDNSILCIVGDGPLRSELEELADTKKTKIIFAGSKTHTELKDIYASADVFVAPSVTAEDGDQEGLGLVMLEAMASGLPIVASKSGGIVQVIRDGENGLLCEEKAVNQIAGNINKALYDSDVRNELIKGSYKTAQEYDYKIQAEKYMNLYESILKKEL